MLNRYSFRLFVLLFVCFGFGPWNFADEKNSKSQKQKPSKVELRALVTNLASPKFEEREASLAALIEAGMPAIAPLADAVMSGDPEVAWRAATALEAIGLEGDEAILGEIKTRMERTKGTPNRDLAQILGTLTQRWAVMQQTKSQTALLKLGAVFPDPNSGYAMAYPTGAGPGGTVFLGGYSSVPTFSSSGTVIVESFATPIATIPVIPTPSASSVYDPLAVPSSLERIISGMEKIASEKSDEAEDAKKSGEKEDKRAESQKKEEPKKEPKSEGEKKSDDSPKRDEKRSDQKSSAEESKPGESQTEKSDDAKPKESEKSGASSDASTADKAAPEPITVTLADVAIDAPAVEMGFVSPSSYGGMPTAAVYGVIRLDRNYHGGDSGLVHLAGLPHISTLDIQDASLTDKAIPYIAKMSSLASIMIRGTKITPEALFKLKKARPGLSIRGQGRGILGVNADESAADCRITVVRPGTPSEAAGILVDDRIIKLDGKEVTDFLSLTVQMMNREAGEVVKVTIKRGEETLEKKVKLASREEISR